MSTTENSVSSPEHESGSDFPERVRSALQNFSEVPALSEAAEKLLEVINQPESTIEAIAEVVKLDAGLTARYLQLASSVVYAGEPIATVEEALFRIGLNEARNLGLSLSVIARLAHLEPSFDKRQFWLASLLTARLADSLVGACRQTTGKAYLAGLLYEVGKPLLAHYFQEEYRAVTRRIEEEEGDAWAIEREMLGVTRTEVSALLCERWNLDSEIVQSIRASQHIPAILDKEGVELEPGDLLAIGLWVAKNLAVNCSKASFEQPEDAEEYPFESVPGWKLYEQFPRRIRLRLDLFKEVQKAHGLFEVTLPRSPAGGPGAGANE